MILDDILARKREDLAERKRRVPLAELEARANPWDRRDFTAAVRWNADETRVIAELKKATPSRGVLCKDFRPVERGYRSGGHCIQPGRVVDPGVGRG